MNFIDVVDLDDDPPPPLNVIARPVNLTMPMRKSGFRRVAPKSLMPIPHVGHDMMSWIFAEPSAKKFAADPLSPPITDTHQTTVHPLSSPGNDNIVPEEKIDLTSSEKKTNHKRRFNWDVDPRHRSIQYQENSAWAHRAEVAANVVRNMVETVAVDIEGPRKPETPVPAWMVK